MNDQTTSPTIPAHAALRDVTPRIPSTVVTESQIFGPTPVGAAPDTSTVTQLNVTDITSGQREAKPWGKYLVELLRVSSRMLPNPGMPFLNVVWSLYKNNDHSDTFHEIGSRNSENTFKNDLERG